MMARKQTTVSRGLGILAGICALGGCASQTTSTRAAPPPAPVANVQTPTTGGGLTDQPLATRETVRGRISAFTYSARGGGVDGFVLDTGARVRFPPAAAAQVQSIAGSGAQMEVTGRGHPTAAGDTLLEASIVRNVRTDQALNVDMLAPPGGQAELPDQMGGVIPPPPSARALPPPTGTEVVPPTLP